MQKDRLLSYYFTVKSLWHLSCSSQAYSPAQSQSLFCYPLRRIMLSDLSGQRIIRPRSLSSNSKTESPTDQKLKNLSLMCPRPPIEDKDRTAPPPPWFPPLDSPFRGAPSKQGIPIGGNPSFSIHEFRCGGASFRGRVAFPTAPRTTLRGRSLQIHFPSAPRGSQGTRSQFDYSFN